METAPVSANRLERVLAAMVAGLVGVSVLCFFAIVIGTWLGQGEAQQSGSGVWPYVIMFPWFGLPLAMLLLIALMIASTVRRRREEPQNR